MTSFAPPGDPRAAASPQAPASDIERGLLFRPRFDADGLIPAIVSDAATGAVLMFAWMNEEALRVSLETSVAHFWSRSRRRLWKKGEESGNLLSIVEARTDCDQDVVWLRVTVAGNGVACHTGAASCFYRSLAIGGPAAEGRALAFTPLPAP